VRGLAQRPPTCPPTAMTFRYCRAVVAEEFSYANPQHDQNPSLRSRRCTMIAAPVRCDVDGIPTGAHCGTVSPTASPSKPCSSARARRCARPGWNAQGPATQGRCAPILVSVTTAALRVAEGSL
jgi:hypothetical protein